MSVGNKNMNRQTFYNSSLSGLFYQVVAVMVLLKWSGIYTISCYSKSFQFNRALKGVSSKEEKLSILHFNCL